MERLGSYTQRALGAASYPLRGIYYFARHREFHPLFVGRLLPLSVISFLVYFVLFTFAFLPQFAFLFIFHGWGAWVNAVVLVLGEGLIIIQGLFEGFFVDECRVDVFDVMPRSLNHPLLTSADTCVTTRQATLINYGFIDLIAPHRLLFLDAPDSVKKLGKPTTPAAYQPWSITQMVELIVFLPLNLIPVVGVPTFIMITGTRLGKLSQYRWYKLRGLDRQERKREIRTRTWDYVWFGTVAMILELIPILSLFFLLTTTAGSAMWAARLEEERRGGPDAVRPATSDEEAGGQYADDPV